MKYTINYVKPLYHLCVERKWWIFRWWSTIETSKDFDYLEKEYERLRKEQ